MLFVGCSKIEEVSQLPDSLIDMENAFVNCTNLKKIDQIPENVELLNYTFTGCSNLENILEIPRNIKKMQNTFAGCEKLSGTIKINSSNIEEYSSCFGKQPRNSKWAGQSAEKKYDEQYSIKLVGNGENDDIIKALASTGKYVTY